MVPVRTIYVGPRSFFLQTNLNFKDFSTHLPIFSNYLTAIIRDFLSEQHLAIKCTCKGSGVPTESVRYSDVGTVPMAETGTNQSGLLGTVVQGGLLLGVGAVGGGLGNTSFSVQNIAQVPGRLCLVFHIQFFVFLKNV